MARRYTPDVARRDPHDVLGVRPGATAGAVKAAWRRLAREHHPDLTGDDPAASRVATRRMAEINEAYESLRRAANRAEGDAATASQPPPDFDPDAPIRRGGPPRARPTRPVTGRVDTSDTYRARNATSGAAGGGASGRRPSPSGTAGPSSAGAARTNGAAPGRYGTIRPTRPEHREPPRASDPTGPMERARLHRFRAAPPPSLDAARAHELEFGKFRGHTLGEVAAFEPSYVDWLAKTITRDRDLVMAARVVQDDLDRRGVRRRERPERTTAGRSA